MAEKTHEHRFPGDINPKDPTLTLTEYKPGVVDWRKSANIKAPDVMNNLYLAFKEFILGGGNRSLMVVSSDTGLGKTFLLHKAMEEVGCNYGNMALSDEPGFNVGAIRGLTTEDTSVMFCELLNYSGTWVDKDGIEHERIFVLDNMEAILKDKCCRSYIYHLLTPYPDNRYLIDHVTLSAHPFRGRFIILMNEPLWKFAENDSELRAILDGYAVARDIRMDITEQWAILAECFQSIDLYVDNPHWSQEQEATAKDEVFDYISKNVSHIRCDSLLNSYRRIVLDVLEQSKLQKKVQQMGDLGRKMFGDRFDWHDYANQELGLSM